MKSGTIFCQSLYDFPCPVTLGKKTPDFGLHRFKEGLRFIPPDDEGFTMRGDKWRLLYKGRRKSHRFTILGDTAFEYDCILEKEPETNVISLLMEGAEKFDFFRQPDFVRDDFLKGSYAVYKKETLVGEGTGKLCHIHRPEIIDARGRRCWGELSVIGNELHITIPEWFLSEAKYPVIVDPTLGTTTIGSQTYGTDPDDLDYPFPFIENQIAVNKYTVPNRGGGSCTAYVYAYERNYSCGIVKPCIFTNNSSNKPYLRKSRNENGINIELWSTSIPIGWKNGTFTLDGFIEVGTSIWFGVYGSCFTTKFDYSGQCYKLWVDEEMYNVDYDDIPPYLDIQPWDSYCTIKWSWYFNYTEVLPQNYVRTITQGVKLTDARTRTANYKRNLTQTAKINSLIGRFETFYRKCLMNVNNVTGIFRYPFIFRKIEENVKAVMDLFNWRSLYRKLTENINANSQTFRIFSVIRTIQDALNVSDNKSYSIIFIRTVNDDVKITDIFNRWGDFFRGLRDNSETIAETTHKAEYYRYTTDTVHVATSVFRGLLLFVKIVSKVVIRDYILRRFLKAKEDFILKSPVCTEIILDSKID